MDVLMEKVSKMPPSRGRRGYAEQAADIRASLILASVPTLVATDDSRNSLETLSRHLKDFKDVDAVVAIHTKNDKGEPELYGLYAEYKP